MEYKHPILLNRKLRPLLFLPWHLFKKTKNMSYKLNGIISYGIYEDDDKGCLIGFYGWTKLGKKYRKEFVNSNYGYDNAIQWIEAGRRSLIEELL
jgi:hypothetical protein